MVVKVIRDSSTFTIYKNGILYVAGQEVDLTDAEIEANKHKLEGEGLSFAPVELSLENDFPAFSIDSITPEAATINEEFEIQIKGSYFLPEASVTIAGATVTNVAVLSCCLITATVSAQNPGKLSLEIASGGETLTLAESIDVIDISNDAVDFREGGTEFTTSAIEMRSGQSYTRTPTGLSLSASNDWGNWFRFVGDNDAWVQQRSNSTPPTLNIIFQAALAMVGYGSRLNSPASTTQWREGETMAYVSDTRFQGFYGNDGTLGNLVNFNNLTNITEPNRVLRLQLSNFCDPARGATYSLGYVKGDGTGYEQSGLTEREFIAANSRVSDWFEFESLLIDNASVDARMTADEPEIMPFLVPRALEFNLIGIYYL